MKILIVFFFSCFFFLFPHIHSCNSKNCMAYTTDLHTKQPLYYQRLSFSELEIHASWDGWVLFWVRVACEAWLSIMAPNTHRNLSLIHHLCALPYTSWKLHIVHVYGCSAYQTTALLSKAFWVRFRVAWDIWLKSYIARHPLRSLSDATLSCV